MGGWSGTWPFILTLLILRYGMRGPSNLPRMPTESQGHIEQAGYGVQPSGTARRTQRLESYCPASFLLLLAPPNLEESRGL